MREWVYLASSDSKYFEEVVHGLGIGSFIRKYFSNTTSSELTLHTGFPGQDTDLTANVF